MKTAPKSSAVYSFAVSVKGRTGWGSNINARTAGKAKNQYFRELSESWPNIPFTDLRCRKIGRPHSSEAFRRNAAYRGVPDLECGDRVEVLGNLGTVTSHDQSANFVILFDADAPQYAGLTLSVHPDSLRILPKEDAL